MSSLITANEDGINVVDFYQAFEKLNVELAKINQNLDLICVGGYVMQLHGFRGTVDVDAFFDSNTEIDSAIHRVGDELGINEPDENWLNNSASNMNDKPPSDYTEVVHKFSNLTVMKVTIAYLVGMKLNSGRDRDLRDVQKILKSNNDEQPLKLLSELKKMGFEIDISVILDIYHEVYGMDWLETFYRNNQEELSELF